MDNTYTKGTVSWDLMDTAQELGRGPASDDDTARAIDGLTIAAYEVGAGLISVFHAIGAQIDKLAEATRENPN